MMDRGEDDDWFGSPFIVTMALLAFLGIGAAILWLLVAKDPIVNLDVFKDKNFTGGCLMIGAMGAILYASAVIIPVFAQQVLGYTATWSGLILSPGGVIVILLIPLVGQLMRFCQTRVVIATGFFIMGCALVYSSGLVPNIDFGTLVVMRMAQTAALAFLFVPISTITYLTLSRELRGDGAALFSMFRNVFGSIGISASTALVEQRARSSNPICRNGFRRFISLMTPWLRSTSGRWRRWATTQRRPMGSRSAGLSEFTTQVAVLAYSDVFFRLGVVAFIAVPFCFLLSGKTSSGTGAAH